jgi:hypothetical protein
MKKLILAEADLYHAQSQGRFYRDKSTGLCVTDLDLSDVKGAYAEILNSKKETLSRFEFDERLILAL